MRCANWVTGAHTYDRSANEASGLCGRTGSWGSSISGRRRRHRRSGRDPSPPITFENGRCRAARRRAVDPAETLQEGFPINETRSRRAGFGSFPRLVHAETCNMFELQKG